MAGETEKPNLSRDTCSLKKGLPGDKDNQYQWLWFIWNSCSHFSKTITGFLLSASEVDAMY
jgi:hypothetical protein